MGIASIKPDYDLRIKHSSCATHAPGEGGIKGTFISADGHQFQLSDIEMITFETSPYTSLKDLLQTSASPSSWLIMSPNHNSSNSSFTSSWREIPIKDPLLQHAAWAYLMPMSADAEGGPHNRSLLRKLKDCGGIFGCINDVIMVMMKNWAAFFNR